MISPLGQRLADALSDIIVQPVIIRGKDVASIDIDRLPSELILASAREKRQREFAAGRLAASLAIQAIGHRHEYPAIGANREPIWPPKLTGSITHTGTVAMAAVVYKRDIAGLGIDIEELQAIDDSVAASILTAAELDCQVHSNQDVLRLFSFKESIYKCVYPAFGQFIDFKEVEVRSDATGLRATCVDPTHGAVRLVERVRGDSRLVGDHVVSACWLGDPTCS